MYFFNIFDTAVKLKLILTNYAFVLLHTPILIEPNYLVPMWKNANYRVCVDQGSTTLKTYTTANNISMDGMYPELLSGDFKTLAPEILKEYENHGAVIAPTVGDDLTDFTKALYEMAKRKDNVEAIIALVEDDGRLDHLFGNLNTISMSETIFGRYIPIYLLNRRSISWILLPGMNVIQVPKWIKKNDCGILPFAPSKSHVTTTGLTWNLNNQSLQLDGLLSISNRFTDDDKVTVKTDVPLIWTMIVNKVDIYADPCTKDNYKPITHEPNTR